MTAFFFILLSCGLAYLLYGQIRKTKDAVAENAKISAELLKYSPIKDIAAESERLQKELKLKVDILKTQEEEVKSRVEEYQKRLSKYEFDLDIQEFGFYQPKFQFDDVLKYVEALELTREAQKELIRQKKVFINFGNLQATKKLKDIAKLAVSAFNGEVTGVIESVRYDNFEKCRSQIMTSFEKINSLIEDTGMKISESYYDLKIKELALVYDYKEADQKAKEEQIELKAAMREEEKARAEAEEAREDAIREQEQYQEALEKARVELESKSAGERAEYEARIRDLEKKFQEATAERERATSMAQITKKGHIYIISNIGSFGENIFKIGMTRRNEPKDRVKELSDASVPFDFDIHAMVSAEDAPALENSLHRHFGEKRTNRINMRKEFFNITIDEIALACEKLGCAVKLTKVAEARDYRETKKILEKGKAA